MEFTQKEKLLLKRHKLSINEICDATSQHNPDARYKFAKNLEKLFILRSPPCRTCGCRIATRRSKCIECQPKQVAFQKRSQAKAYVYIAGSKSKKLTKIGMTSDILIRERELNSFLYAECNDWRILKYVKINNAGNVESKILLKLSEYFFPSRYYKENKWQPTKEAFTCSYAVAEDALKDALIDETIFEEKNVLRIHLKDYCAFPLIKNQSN